MMAIYIRTISVIAILCLLASCANIVPPTGGKKDVEAPKLLKITPKDSMMATRVTEIEMTFDEFIALDNPSKEIQISPLIPFPLTTELSGKRLKVEIPDSLLKDNTTYRISFGGAIKDLNENNEFKNFNYIFSTGDYFDSLTVSGIVYTAATGKPASDMSVLLYDGEQGDSAVVKKKPLYVTKTDGAGAFSLKGLPKKSFRIYALKDANENLVYDGEEEEIAFIDSLVFPKDSSSPSIILRIFKELPIIDSLDDDTLKKKKPFVKRGRGKGNRFDDVELRYTVAVDTNDTVRRTYDINKPVKISFSNPIDTYNLSKVSLVSDSAGVEEITDFTLVRDTTDLAFLLNANWKENTLYTIKIQKDFATDTAGTKSMPSAHTYRTKSDVDYGIIKVNVASVYNSDKHILQMLSEGDTVYKKVISDTTITIKRLLPGKYALSIIVDENKNGKWDTGDLFGKKQPEYVIPYTNEVELKAGWENVLDFKEHKKKNLNRKGGFRALKDKPPKK